MNATLVGPRRLGARTCVLAVAAVALAASGCGGGSSTSQQAPTASTTATIGGSSPTATATPTPSATDQQAQAYAAAVKTYGRFWRDLVSVINKPGDPTSLGGIARGEAFSYAVQVGRGAISRGYRVRGTVTDEYVRTVSFRFGGTTDKPSVVVLQSCQDLATASYVDAKGRPVPRSASAAKFLRFDVTVVNFSPSVTQNWALDGFKTTAVTSCE